MSKVAYLLFGLGFSAFGVFCLAACGHPPEPAEQAHVRHALLGARQQTPGVAEGRLTAVPDPAAR